MAADAEGRFLVDRPSDWLKRYYLRSINSHVYRVDTLRKRGQCYLQYIIITMCIYRESCYTQAYSIDDSVRIVP